MKHDELAARGRAPGGRPPYGYRWQATIAAGGQVERTYVVDDGESKALRTMARRVIEGASLLRISRELDAAGVTTREGRPWHHATVRAVLVNPAVAGLRVHRREVAGPGAWQPILDRQTWEQVRSVLADPARKRERPATKHLLSGLVFNPAGDPLVGVSLAADKRNRAPFYGTRAGAKPSITVGAAALENLVVEAVLTLTDRSALPAPEVEPGPAGDEIAGLEAELAQLAELRGDGTISLAEWLAARKPLQERIEAAKKSAEAGPRRVSREVRLLDQPGAVRRAWPTLDLAARREILSTLVDRVVIGPATNGRYTDLADRVDIRWRA